MSGSDKNASLKEKLKQALNSTFKVISDDFALNENIDKSLKKSNFIKPAFSAEYISN